MRHKVRLASLIISISYFTGTCLTDGSAKAIEATCGCGVKKGEDVPSLPFSEVAADRLYLAPNRFLNGSRLMHIK